MYKIGLKFKEKKTICNKFPAASSITCLVWPRQRENEILFGLAEGKVKIGFLKNNKVSPIYYYSLKLPSQLKAM